MNLLKTYEHMLNLGGLIVSPDGLVSVALDTTDRPALINVKTDNGNVDKRLVLPTPNQLRLEGGWDNRIAFHPLKENINSGESIVIEYLRKAINYRFNQVISELIVQSLIFSSSTEHHKKLNKDLLGLLEALKDADQTMVNNFKKVLKQVSPTNTKHSFVSIYLKKLGKIGDESFACVGTVNFPFYNELIEAEKEFHGVKLRKNDFACFRRILEFMIPNIQEKGSYNVGVSASYAPFAECLIRVTNKLGNEVNKLTNLLYSKSTHIPKEERESIRSLLYFNDEHMEVFNDLDVLLKEIRLIPQLPGNEPKSAKTIDPPGPIQTNESEEMIPQHQNSWENLTPENTQTNMPPVQQTMVPVQPMQHMTPQQQFNQQPMSAPTTNVTDELPPLRESRPPMPMGYPPQPYPPMQSQTMYPPYQQPQQQYVSPFTPKHMVNQLPPHMYNQTPQMGYNGQPMMHMQNPQFGMNPFQPNQGMVQQYGLPPYQRNL